MLAAVSTSSVKLLTDNLPKQHLDRFDPKSINKDCKNIYRTTLLETITCKSGNTSLETAVWKYQAQINQHLLPIGTHASHTHLTILYLIITIKNRRRNNKPLQTSLRFLLPSCKFLSP